VVIVRFNQTGLADPGLADDDHHLALSGSGLLEAVPEGGHLALAPHESRQAPFGLDLEPAPCLSGRDHLPRRHRLRFALQAELPEGICEAPATATNGCVAYAT
jgi:hypothetical protein